MKKISLFVLICTLLISYITIWGVINVFADTPAEQEPYVIEIENGEKFFYMAPKTGFVKDEKYKSLKSGLYYNTTPPETIYCVDFSSNTSKQYPRNYAYENIILSSDGTYFADIPWAVTGTVKYDDQYNIINFDEIAKEAISFYKNGIHMRTYSVSDLLKDMTKARFSTSHVMWENYQKREFDSKYNLLKITTNDDILYMFDISTGKIIDSTDGLTAVPTSPQKITVLPYNYNQTWNGTGTLSMKIDGYNYEKFSYLEHYAYYVKDGEKIDASNYTVSGTSEYTNIIFTEKYLKTLSDGDYTFYAIFSDVDQKQSVALENQRTDIPPYLLVVHYTLTDKPVAVHDVIYLENYLPDHVEKGRIVVDKKNYTHEEVAGHTRIDFTEEYANSLPKETLFFEVLYTADVPQVCAITIERENILPTTQPESSDNNKGHSSAYINNNPDTGEENKTIPIIIVGLSSFVLCFVFGKKRKYN